MTSTVDYTADLHDLARLVAMPNTTQEVLERALLALRGVVPYDLAAVFRIADMRARVVASAGPLAQAVQHHELDLRRFPTIRRALETRRPVALEEHDHAGPEGDPYDGVLDLPHGHSCMVVPLFAGDRTLGLVTPGNVRQLVNALERATILQAEGEIRPEHLGLGASNAPASCERSAPSWADNERRYFESLLSRTGGKLYGPDGAAAHAGLKPTTLRSKLVKHGLR